MVTPIIRSLHEDTGAEIVTIGDAAFRPIYADLPGVIAHIDLPSGEPSYLDLFRAGIQARRYRCDAALCLRFHRRCTLVAKAAGCPIRVGAVRSDRTLGYKLTNNVYDEQFASLHQVEKYYRVAEGAAGRALSRQPTFFHPRCGRPGIARQDTIQTPYIVVHVGNGGSNLDWGDHNFASLVNELRSRIPSIVVTGDGSGDAFYPRCRAAATADLAGKLNLDELAEIYANAVMVVALDGGGGRLASAVGTKIVNIAIGSRWTTEQVRPWMAPGIVVEPRRRCAGCKPGHCDGLGNECIRSLPVEDVITAVDQLQCSTGRSLPRPTE